MRVCLEVILIAVAVEVKRELLRLLRRDAAHIAHIFRCFAVCLLLTGGTGIGETLLHIIHLRIKETIAPHQSGVEHAQCGYRLESFVGLCSLQRIATAATDAKYADALGIHAGILCQDVASTMDVLDAVGRLVHVTRLALASALIGRIESKADVALLRHALAVKSGHLFLATSVGMRHHESGIGFRCVISGRGIDVGGYLQSVQVVSDTVNVHFSRFVPGNGTPINQSERIVVGALNRIEINYSKRFCHLCFNLSHCVGRATKEQRNTQRHS